MVIYIQNRYPQGGNKEMPEITDTDTRKEIAALTHDVARLTKELNDEKTRQVYAAMPDKYDPFGNPTEYKGINGDYTKIQPRISEMYYSLPLEPDFTERKNLRRSYGKGAWCMLLHFALQNALVFLLIKLMVYVVSTMNPGAEYSAVTNYLRGSSILVGLNLMICVSCNVLVALIGMKWSGIKSTSLIRTNDFGFGRAFQYCMIGMLIWTVSLYLVAGASSLFSKYGIDILIDSSGLGKTIFGKVILAVYTAILAPVTEELFFRGVLLRTLSKANQRFAIVASALFFGLFHGNIQQFILATLLGIFLAHITLKHGSIIPSIIVHAFVNTTAGIVSFFAGLSTASSVLTYLALLGVALVGVIMLLVFNSRDKIPSTTPAQARRGLTVAAGSLPFIAAVVVLVADTVINLMSKK